jgi:hypothetical protein
MMLILSGKTNRIYNSGTVNVVWQYLYNMRLSKLKGLNEDWFEPSDDKWKFASEKFVQTVLKYKKEHMFHKKIQIPEGEIHTSIQLDQIPYTFVRYNEDKYLGEIHLRIDFMPKMDPKPVIPLNILQVSVADFVDSLLKINPDIMARPSIYPPDLLDCYHLKLQNISVHPGQGILHLRDYMDTPTYNLKLLSPSKFGDIMFSRSLLLNRYSLTQGDLPTFSDGYSLAMSKLIKKAKSVYHALKKGTWRGHTYELFEPYDWSRGFVVHQDKFNYNRTDKVLHPNFEITCNFGWEIVDGKKNSPEESPLSDEEQKEFRQYLKNRFKNFDIGY